MPLQRFKYYIGIDCGASTGLAIWCKYSNRFRQISTVKIHEAMAAVKYWNDTNPGEIKVRVEDARKRKWFGEAGPEQLQGAGSIKRDAKIWEDYLTDLKIEFEMVAPKNNRTKLKADKFILVTGYKGKTTEHSRDAAMLVFGI